MLDEETLIEIHRQYVRGEISREVTERLLGDELMEIERERESFAAAAELDTTGVFQRE